MLSLGLHLFALDQRPFHSDEAIHAKLSYQFAYMGEYRYDPTYHGPFLYYLVALVYWIFGDSDFTARLPAALSGVSMLLVCWKISSIFGNKAAWWTGLLFTISPLYLYYGRFLRMDILEVLTASLAFLSLYEAVWLKKERAWITVGIWSALAFATKENAYITAVLAISTAIVILLNLGWRKSLHSFYTWLQTSWHGPLTAFSLWIIFSLALYTVFFRYPQDWIFPYKAIIHWAEQHNIERVGGPWWYHLFRLAQYEFLILITATIWVFRQSSLKILDFSLYFFGCASLAMYAYLGEKVPWLGIHQVWAFMPLAGAQMARTLGLEGCWWSRTLAGIGIAVTLIISLAANFSPNLRSPQPQRTESLYYSDTTVELQSVAREIVDKEKSASGMPPVASVQGIATWPLTWYWRHESIYWSLPKEGSLPDLVLVDIDKRDLMDQLLGSKYSLESIPVRAWWFPENDMPTVADLFHYLITREPWTPVTFNEALVLRRKPGE